MPSKRQASRRAVCCVASPSAAGRKPSSISPPSSACNSAAAEPNCRCSMALRTVTSRCCTSRGIRGSTSVAPLPSSLPVPKASAVGAQLGWPKAGALALGFCGGSAARTAMLQHAAIAKVNARSRFAFRRTMEPYLLSKCGTSLSEAKGVVCLLHALRCSGRATQLEQRMAFQALTSRPSLPPASRSFRRAAFPSRRSAA